MSTTDSAASTQDGHGFTVVLRGYDRDHVDGLIQRAADALAADSAADRSAAAALLAAPTIPTVWRGYERGQVDAQLRRLTDLLTTPPAGGNPA